MTSGIFAETTAMEIQIEDEQGIRNGKSVLVYLDYVKEVDLSYGEDADGRRGIPLVEYTVLEKRIDLHDLTQLTIAEVGYALTVAELKFYTTQKHF